MASNESELFRDKIEVSLDGRQIFYLFFGSAVVATLVFVLGVMVGRRVEARAVAEVGSPATDPLAALDRLEGANDLAFPATLRGDEVSLGSVDEQLGQRTIIAKPSKSAVSIRIADAMKVKKAADDLKAEEKKARNAEREARKLAATQKADARDAERAAKEEAEEEAKKREPKSRFTLQVGSFQDKSEADSFFRQLDGTLYDPYMVKADVPGKGTYFRVRVGGYGTFDEAVKAKSIFEDKQHVIAYVTRLK